MLEDQVDALEVKQKEMHGRAVASARPDMFVGDPRVREYIAEAQALRTSVQRVMAGKPLEGVQK